jgi:hypothetical protein
MSAATDNKKILKGGEFVISESDAQSVFTPEDLNEEQQMFGSALKDFIETKVHPHIARIDKGDHDLVVQLLEEIGEMGYLGSSIPEEYGGMDMDLNTETLISENMGQTHSFGVAFAAHTGIGSLPVLYYGTEEQKKKYLPGLANGKLKAAYCLTEPGAGSDALSAKTNQLQGPGFLCQEAVRPGLDQAAAGALAANDPAKDRRSFDERAGVARSRQVIGRGKT